MSKSPRDRSDRMMRLHRPDPAPEPRDRPAAIACLVDAGWTTAEIADAFGIGHRWVQRNYRKHRDRPAPPVALTAAEIERLAKEYSETPELSPEERAEALDFLDSLIPSTASAVE